METSSAGSTDIRLGYAIVLGLGVIAGGIAMLLAPGEQLGAAGFALAILAGLGLILALHIAE